jgi:hypothetical protein
VVVVFPTPPFWFEIARMIISPPRLRHMSATATWFGRRT